MITAAVKMLARFMIILIPVLLYCGITKLYLFLIPSELLQINMQADCGSLN